MTTCLAWIPEQSKILTEAGQAAVEFKCLSPCRGTSVQLEHHRLKNDTARISWKFSFLEIPPAGGAAFRSLTNKNVSFV